MLRFFIGKFLKKLNFCRLFLILKPRIKKNPVSRYVKYFQIAKLHNTIIENKTMQDSINIPTQIHQFFKAYSI